MGEVELPFVESTTEIEAALKVMADSDRSAIVTETQHQLFVLTDEDLISTLREFGDLPIAKAVPSHRTLVAPVGAGLQLSFSNQNDRGRISDIMKDGVAHFAFERSMAGNVIGRLAASGVKVKVITVSKYLSETLGRRQILCRCQTNPHHVWRQAALVVSGKCNKDGDPVVCS
jgi:CBS domain-containing protein